MLVLLTLDADAREGCASANDLAAAAFDIVNTAYDYAVMGDDYYLYRPDPACKDIASLLSFVDGAKDPDRVRQMANDWNNEVQQAFERALVTAESHVKCPSGARRQWLNLPSDDIFELQKAVSALYDQFYPFADRALLVNGKGDLTTVLMVRHLDDVLAHPENYAAIEVTPK